MKLANWLSEILKKLFACKDIWLTALPMLLAMINKEKHASVSWHVYGYLTRLVFDARSRYHSQFRGYVYSINSFLRHLCEMLSLFPEKLCQVFGELVTKIGTQGVESLWAYCLLYCCEGVQIVKQFPLSLWLGLAVDDRLSEALFFPVETRAAFEELLRALTSSDWTKTCCGATEGIQVQG